MLFFKKWRSEEGLSNEETRYENEVKFTERLSGFLDYLEKGYLDHDSWKSNFYRGSLNLSSVWSCRTNNSTEKLNSTIKRIFTNSRVVSLDSFVCGLLGAPMINMSTQNSDIGVNDPPLPTSTMVCSAKVLFNNFENIHYQINQKLLRKTEFYGKNVVIFKKRETSLPEPRILSLISSDQHTFEEYVNDRKQVCLTVCPLDGVSLSSPGSYCSCTVYGQRNICEHLIALGILHGVFRDPSIAAIPSKKVYNFSHCEVGNKSKWGVVGKHKHYARGADDDVNPPKLARFSLTVSEESCDPMESSQRWIGFNDVEHDSLFKKILKKIDYRIAHDHEVFVTATENNSGSGRFNLICAEIDAFFSSEKFKKFWNTSTKSDARVRQTVLDKFPSIPLNLLEILIKEHKGSISQVKARVENILKV